MSRHVCPPWCHRCPDMDGDVLPRCWGSVHRNDLLGCHCYKPDESTKKANAFWDDILIRLARIEAKLGVSPESEKEPRP